MPRYQSFPKIWILDSDPVKSVRYLCDRDVGTVIKGSYYMLMNAYWYTTGIRNTRIYNYMMDDLDRKDIILTTTFQHFPLGEIPKFPNGKTPEIKFARQCMNHFLFTKEYFAASLDEYSERFYKDHPLADVLDWITAFPPNLPMVNMEIIYYPMKIIPFKYRERNIVNAMRNWYKRKLFNPIKAYNRVSVPEWFGLTEKDVAF